MPKISVSPKNLRIWNEQSLQRDQAMLIPSPGFTPSEPKGEKCVILSTIAGVSIGTGVVSSAFAAQFFSEENDFSQREKVITAITPGLIDLVALVSTVFAVSECSKNPPPGSSDDEAPRMEPFKPARRPETRRVTVQEDDWTAELLLIGAATAYAAWESAKFVGGLAALLAFGN